MTKNPAFLIRLLDYARIIDRIRILKKPKTFVAALTDFITERCIQTPTEYIMAAVYRNPH